MEMLNEVSGRNITRAMRELAKEAFSEYSVGCVCVGVKSGAVSSRRGIPAVVALSGDTGRTLLLKALKDNGSLGRDATKLHLIGLMQAMTSELVTYRSSVVGSGVKRTAGWETHNCGESALALYVYKSGLGTRLRDFTIASYEMAGTTIRYKPLCANCVQWCRNQFDILREYEETMG